MILMLELYIKTAASGILFGLWPLVMSRSGLDGVVSATVFALVQACILLPIGFYVGFPTTSTNWIAAILAGGLSSLGLLAFTDVLVKSPKEDVGRMFVLVIIVQVLIPTLYQFVGTGSITLKQIGGFAAALVAIILLS